MVLEVPIGVGLPANALLRHRVQTGISFDESKGHDIPKWEYIDIPATLDEVERPPRRLSRPQQSSPSIRYFEGWSAIDLNPTYHLAIDATISGKKGVLHLEPTMQESGVYQFELDYLTGYPVKGWFEAGARL